MPFEFKFADLQTAQVISAVEIDHSDDSLWLPIRLGEENIRVNSDFLIEKVFEHSLRGDVQVVEKLSAWLRHMDVVQFAIDAEAKHKTFV